MTDQEVLELLQEIDSGYEPTEEERVKLSRIEKLGWKSIKRVPESIGYLTSLQDLNLGKAQINELPENIGNLRYLKNLDLDHTQIRELPESIGNLTSLQNLNLDSNTRISEIPECIGNLTGLQNFDLGHTLIGKLPESIGKLKSLRNFRLGVTQIRGLPESIGNLTSLQSLNLFYTQIRELPESIGNLSNLLDLDLGDAQIRELPESIGNLTDLQSLDLGHTQIRELPESIGNLTNLKRLDLYDTLICYLPESIGNLTHLQRLDLGLTEISELPKSINNLRGLKQLLLESCSLNELPESLLSFNLEYRENDFDFQEYDEPGIYIHGLKLQKQPVSLFSQPRELIENYYRQKRIPVNETKVIFLGSEGVGKTHTIKRILNDNHKISVILKETPGISITSKGFFKEDFSYRINFWDFGGQEIMHSMHRCFLTNRTGYVIVVSTRYGDVTAQAEKWLRNLQSFAKDAPVIVFVNVWNSGTYYGINESTLRREFENIKEVVHCSAKDSSDSEFAKITSSIQKLAEKNDSIGMYFPETWENVRQEIISHGTQDYYINTEAYKEICKKQGVENESIQGWLLDWFNDLGECFTYQSGQEMVSGNQYSMILNPEWLTNAVYLIIRELGEEAERGVVSHKKIKKLLGKPDKGTLQGVKYSSDECEYILEVMRRHLLSYKIPGKEEEFIPSLLQNCPDKKHTLKGKISSNYEIRYSYLPENVVHRLMVEYYALVDKNDCWRDDFAICINGIHGIESLAYISADYDKNVISIQIEQYTENETWELLQAIRDTIIEINEKLNLHAQDFIIIDSNDENGVLERVSVRRLLKLQERNVETYEAYEKSFNIDALLGKAYGVIAVRDVKQKAKSEGKYSIDDLIEMLGRRDAKNFLHMKIRELLSIDDVYDYTVSACRQIQGRMIFWTRTDCDVTEDTRNDELRDLIASRGLYVRDQSHAGHGEQGYNPGEVDLAIMKSEADPVPMTLIEAMNLSGVNSSYILEHLDKLVDGYNDSGIRDLFLVSYVELEKGKFASFWTRYKKKIKTLNGKEFTVDAGSEPMVNESLAWIKSMKMAYDYDGAKFFVYHICVRVAE